jgi:hypothetical protein
MNRYHHIILFCYAALLCGCRPDLARIKHDCTAIDRLPLITPDYSGITIPPNIAPLNFILKDSCASCVSEIASAEGPPIVTWGKKGTFRIDPSQWKRLLVQNAGKTLCITIYARDRRGAWRAFKPIQDTIAVEPIDRYCTYRLLSFQYNYSSDLRECQRDLTSFNETVLVNSQNYAWGCVNCHMPLNNDPSRFVLQARSNAYGSETIIADGDALTTFSSRFGHTAWHPSGKYIASSVYKVEQYFHSVGRQFIDVYDKNSHVVVYNIATRKIVPAPMLNQQGVLETWPAWSPDGRYLYFCSSPVLWSDDNKDPPDNFNKTRYSLLRIAFDAEKNEWGIVDTVLSPASTGLSITQPKISPDNRFCLFCMHNYGAYPHTQVSSDLYLMDIPTRQYRTLPINSEYNEGWHSWSKNGRWIIFSSKRGGGIFTRLYFSAIDSAGNAHKPFIVPQRDPAFYDSFIKCYNVPELAIAPVPFSERQLLKAIKTKRTVPVPFTPNTQQSADSSRSAWEALPGSQQ